MKIIFLDIDGVLNCEEAYEYRLNKGYCLYKNIDNPTSTKKQFQQFYPECKKWLNKLIKESGAKIVISSTWRVSGMNWLNDVWRMEEMEGEIIDITPKLHLYNGYSVVRGQEIQDWMRGKGFWGFDSNRSDIENYIIIDDDSDMLYNQRNNFVHVLPSPINKKGFTEEHYIQGLNILNNTI